MAAERTAYKVPDSLSLHAIKVSQIPAEHVLISDAQEILEASTSWEAGKVYHDVATFAHQEYKDDTRSTHSWHCAVSRVHPDEGVSFKRMWAKLGHNQVWNSKSYLPTIAKATRVKYISESQSIWTVLCTYPPPISPRVFTVYQASWLFKHSHRRKGIVVTLPIDLSSRDTADLAELEEKGVRGRYVAIELLRETDDGMVEWRRIARVDPGGMLPKFWTAKQFPSRMAETNVSFLKWCHSLSLEESYLGDNEDDRRDGNMQDQG